ncbi:MOSC domain-containing protein [Micromonospora sp. CPCC 206061]|uniref:MOSC domain-containing protein n=1 Tax=Micromonospora sp. CPCC 206061 TaxID=3122410 RepID=UPI002FF2CF4D
MHLEQLWRYPVKSIGGERLDAVAVGVLGIEGDRGIGVRDERDEFTWAGDVPGLMRVGAVTVEPGVVELHLPDGRRVRSDAPDADRLLSEAVEAKVTLDAHQTHWLEGALHVMTTTTLRSLAAALPDSAIDVTRFRPNLVLDGAVDDGTTGHPEQGWIGRRLAIGGLRLRFTQPCERCVMITKETTTVPHDRAVLRWVARELGNSLGVYAAVETPGTVHVGDTAHWLD